jgi:hypothetical protein
MDIKAYVDEVRYVVRTHRSLWRQLEKEGVVSYAWLARFAGGDFDNPGIFTLEKVKAAIDDAAKSAA